LWRSRDFTLFWAGQTIGDLGTAVSAVVLPLIAVTTLDASAFAVGALGAAEYLPWLLIGLPAGAWVDRLPYRPVLVGCDLVRLVLIGSVPVTAALGGLGLSLLYAVAFGTGVATVLWRHCGRVDVQAGGADPGRSGGGPGGRGSGGHRHVVGARVPLGTPGRLTLTR
jgi:hypothetical protein